MKTAHCEKEAKSIGDLRPTLPHQLHYKCLACYISCLCYSFLSLSSLDPQQCRQALQDIDQTARDTVTVREDPHLQGAVRTTGEDAVTRSCLHLHDASTNVAEDGLFSMLGAKRVHQPVAGQFPHLEIENAWGDRMAQTLSFSSLFHTKLKFFHGAESVSVLVRCQN